ncbi:MAG: preprotein translocase subunit SecG [Pseudomonadota bacterium]
MTNVILVAHILVSIVLVIVVLMQRSEGGALGIGGGGGGGGGLMTGSGVTGALVRTTIIFGAIFFVSSLTLTTLATKENADGRTDVQRQLEGTVAPATEGDDLGLDNLDDILSGEGSLLDDPLSVNPTDSPPADDTGANDDPLASGADPQ